MKASNRQSILRPSPLSSFQQTWLLVVPALFVMLSQLPTPADSPCPNTGHSNQKIRLTTYLQTSTLCAPPTLSPLCLQFKQGLPARSEVTWPPELPPQTQMGNPCLTRDHEVHHSTRSPTLKSSGDHLLNNRPHRPKDQSGNRNQGTNYSSNKETQKSSLSSVIIPNLDA